MDHDFYDPLLDDAAADDMEEREQRLIDRLRRQIQGNVADLRLNFMRESDVPVLLYCLRPHLTTLVELSLKYCDFGDTVLESIFAALSRQAPCLRLLNVSRTGLDGALTPSLFHIIRNSTTLQTLDVSWTHIAGHASQNLADAVACNTSLLRLDAKGLSLNVFGRNCPLIRALWRHPRIRRVAIDTSLWSPIDTKTAVAGDIARLFALNNRIRKFSVLGVVCTDTAVVTILRALHHNTGLTKLRMGRMNGTVEDVWDETQALLLVNVTLTTLPDFGYGTNYAWQLQRNEIRRRSRIQRARQAFDALFVLRFTHRVPAMRLIDRHIMNKIGCYIKATKLKAEWEDPAVMDGDGKVKFAPPMTKRARHDHDWNE